MSVVDKQRKGRAAVRLIGQKVWDPHRFATHETWRPRPPDGSGRFIPRTINQQCALYMQLSNTGTRDSNGLPRCSVAVSPAQSFQHVLRKSRLLAGVADLKSPCVRGCTPGIGTPSAGPLIVPTG
jgi:hypothetical protein